MRFAIQGEHMLKGKELPAVAFATFKSRCGAALAAQSQQNSHPLIMITEMAPQPKDVSWRSLAIPLKFMPLYKIGIIVLASLLTIFFAVPVTAVQGIAKFEKLKKWFPPAMAIELIPGVSSILTGFLPSAVLRGFLYIVPLQCLALLKEGPYLMNIGEYVSHPKNYPSHLASAVSAQADFFMTYILTDGLSGFSLEILQPALFLWDSIVLHTCGRGKDENPYLYSLPYYRIIPSVSLSILIGMVYAVVSPFLLPLLVGYFCLGYIVYVNQLRPCKEEKRWGGSLLSAFLQVLLERMASREVLDFFKGRKLNDSLLKKLKTTMISVNGVLDDAEKKQT
ncbi:hypothetical protein GH714_016940 [Hevea brasiliensis]|uniref:CSC1/OSCA1-like 7TM region domain-containing protein n=1 Tax=Hevea brasiliensis TaxID=3981 RepID=A0A6A6NBZ6_HEVBR|nr:hypothetical protein GH714_016940 [Hevea brasiliensis]